MDNRIPLDHPLWSSASLNNLATSYDGKAQPTLGALAAISATTAAVGYATQYDVLTWEIFLRCLALGFALWAVARAFWSGAWTLPALESKLSITIYAVVAVIGFAMFGSVSTLGTLGANGNGISEDIVQNENIDGLANFGQKFGIYSGQMAVTQAALRERADQAGASREAEIDGRGPSGQPGRGPVSNAFEAANGKYADAADLLENALTQANSHLERLSAIISDLRSFQADRDLNRTDRSATLKALSGQAIGEMRALLALDPARSIVAAADLIDTGVPEPSRASESSRARIVDIRAEMQSYAASLRREADRIAALAPELPQLVTLSPAEKLIHNMWRMPGLTLAAILMDACGWVVIFYRLAIYQALKARLARESANGEPEFIPVRSIQDAAMLQRLAEEGRKAIEDLRPTAKRGRPPKSANMPRTDSKSDREDGE